MSSFDSQAQTSQKPAEQLSEAIRDGLASKGMSSDMLVDRLRISPDTIECLLAGSALHFMPEIYVRGYLRQIADELALDDDKMWSLYKAAHQKVADEPDVIELSVMPFRKVALTAGLAGVGILAVIVAFLGG